jgi:hypothetical protein
MLPSQDSRCAVNLLLSACCNQAHSPATRDFPVAGSHTALSRRPPPIAEEKNTLAFAAVDTKTISGSDAAAAHLVYAEAELEAVRERSAALLPRIPSAGLRQQQQRLQPQPPGTRGSSSGGGSCSHHYNRCRRNISIAAVAAAARTGPPLIQRASCAGPQITGELWGVQKDASLRLPERACLLLEVLFTGGLRVFHLK